MGRLTIMDFAWQHVQPVVGERITAGQLWEWATQRQPYPFIVHDSYHGTSAVVSPAGVIAAINESGGTPDTPVVESGLLDRLRSEQLIVGAAEPAREVIRRTTAENASVVIVVDEVNFPRGLFVPSSVRQRLQETLTDRHGYAPPPWVQDTIEALQPTPVGLGAADQPAADLIRAFDILDTMLDEFHSENLNQRNPVVGVCPDHGVQHLTILPCRAHAGMTALGELEIR